MSCARAHHLDLAAALTRTRSPTKAKRKRTFRLGGKQARPPEDVESTRLSFPAPLHPDETGDEFDVYEMHYCFRDVVAILV